MAARGFPSRVEWDQTDKKAKRFYLGLRPKSPAEVECEIVREEEAAEIAYRESQKDLDL